MSTGEDVAYELGLAGVDPASLGKALGTAALAVATQPGLAARALGELVLEESAVGLDVARSMLGAAGEPPVKPDPGDRRFGDRAWTENPFLRGAAESYLVASRLAQRTLAEARLPEQTARKAGFALRLLLDAAAPTNILGVCLCGTLTAMALGLLAARGEAERIGAAALVNTLVDYSDPREVAVFTDEESIARIE